MAATVSHSIIVIVMVMVISEAIDIGCRRGRTSEQLFHNDVGIGGFCGGFGPFV